jgi:Ca2+-binding RTX toxin-like protein
VGRRTIFLLATTALAVLLSSGVALALNTINCEGSGIRCVGTDRPDLMQGTAGIDAMYGRDKGDTLKGFGKGDALLGQKGDDTLLGGASQDFLIGGEDDDKLRGEDALDIYYFERSEWGQDTISEVSPRNILRLPNRENFSCTITTNLNSGLLPEVTNSDNTSTVNWKGDVISIVIGSTGNDTVTGNDAANDIFDGEELDTDADTISGAGANDLLDVRDGAGDDEVACGEGNDTVYFDEGDVVVVPGDCEEQNPIGGGSGLEGRQATTYGAGVLGEAPALVVEGHRP